MGHGFFGFSPPNAARRSNIFMNLHRRDSCLTVNNIWVFHLGGGSTPSCYAQHTYIYFHFFQNRVTLLDCVPLPESTNQHHTVLTHNHVPMTLHRTPNTVSIPTMHSHPCQAMFSYTCNAIMPIVYIYMSATYTMITICAHLLMHIHPCIISTFTLKCIPIPNHVIQHSTHQVQACTCILTKFLNIPWIIIINTYNSPSCTTQVNTSYSIH